MIKSCCNCAQQILKEENALIDYKNTIKELRDKLIMTQAELADCLGVSLASINRWENGLNKPITSAKRKIVGLCKANNVKITEVSE